MRFILTVPNEILLCLQNADKVYLHRRMLEFLAIEGYKNDLLTQRQIMLLLNITEREKLWEFFEKNGVRFTHTLEDL